MKSTDFYPQLAAERGRMNRAETNLTCIAGVLNTIARETDQAECHDYLEYFTLRDALQRIVYGVLEKARDQEEGAYNQGYTAGWNARAGEKEI